MDLKTGSRWKSVVCDAEVVVVRPPKVEATLECGGYPVIAHSEAEPEGKTIAEGFTDGSQAGKRYADDETGMEVLCTRTGQGALTIGGRPIRACQGKKLPASD